MSHEKEMNFLAAAWAMGYCWDLPVEIMEEVYRACRISYCVGFKAGRAETITEALERDDLFLKQPFMEKKL